jgi:protoporphyrin/coproporphyrin ferrochelatase
MSEKLGVVLLNLGGPDSLEAVEPFLYNLFRDPDIIDFPLSFLFRKGLAKVISSRRAPRVMDQYKAIGGKSPIREYTEQQAVRLEDELNRRGLDARVYVAMRYWRPSTGEALDAIERDGVTRVILLPLYPQYSKATTLSSMKEWEKQVRQRGSKISAELIDSYFSFPPYIDAFVERVEQGLGRFPEDKRDGVNILFSAHGTPMKLVRQGDPYSHQIAETVEAIMKRGGFTQAHHLCYQSKVGPLKWLEPSTPDTIHKLAAESVNNMLLVPVAFASDHLETLFELGIEYRREANEAGVSQYEVTEGLNLSPKFIGALVQLVFDKVGYTESDRSSNAVVG